MAVIHSDNSAVDTHLRRLESLIEDSGGGLHSRLVFKVEGKSITLETDGDIGVGKELIRMNRKNLLAHDQFYMTVREGEFYAEPREGGYMSDTQAALLECMMDIYNETSKVEFLKETSIYLALKDYPSIVDKLRQGRELPMPFEGGMAMVLSGASGVEYADFLAETFLKTRVLGYSDPVRTHSVSVLMPVLDFANHHWLGASYSVDSRVRQADLHFSSAQPIGGNLECFAFYGSQDVLDTYVRYDFPDVDVPVVRSIPVDLDVPGFGAISIGAVTSGGGGMKEMPKGERHLMRYYPEMSFEVGDEGGDVLKLKFLFLGLEEARPNATMRVLATALRKLEGKAGRQMDPAKKRAWLVAAQDKIVEDNKAYYKEFDEILAPILADNPDADGPKMMRLIIDAQLEKLDRYASVAPGV